MIIEDEQMWNEILHEIETLCTMHERITQSSECREFNHRSAQLLQKLEDAECNRLADRAMDLLVSCNPKDLSHCDSVQRARDALERLRELARAKTWKKTKTKKRITSWCSTTLVLRFSLILLEKQNERIFFLKGLPSWRVQPTPHGIPFTRA